MRSRPRFAATAVALIASAAAFVTAHQAATASPVTAAATAARFTEFSVTPDHVGVDHVASYRGRLVYTGSQGADLPATGALVHLETSGPASLGSRTVKVDANGDFSGTAEIHASESIHAVATGAFSGQSADVSIVADTARTRLTASLDTQPTKTYQRIKISGRLERQTADGGWLPMPRRMVSCAPTCDTPSGNIYVRADGTFSETVITTPIGAWTLSYDPAGQAFDAASAEVRVADPSVLQDYSAFSEVTVDPVHVVPGAQVHITGRLLSAKTFPVTDPVPNAIVDADFLPDGENTYVKTVEATTGADGRFSVTGSVPRSGTWTLWFRGDRHHTSAEYRGTPHVLVDQISHFDSVSAAPKPVRKGRTVKVTGHLTAGNGVTEGGVVGGEVTLAFRAKGTTRWVKIKTAVTDHDGMVVIPAKAAKSGYWRLSYAGDSTTLPADGSAVYVRVVA